MSKLLKQLAIAVMTTAIAISGTATTTTTPLPKVTAQAATTAKQSITLNLKKTTMYVGEADTLSVKKVKGLKSKAVTFKSSNSAIVSVNSKGKVSAKKAGKATITVTSKSNKAVKSTCTITVQNAPATKKIDLGPYHREYYVGEKVSIPIRSVEGVSSDDVTFISNDSSKVFIDKNGIISIPNKKVDDFYKAKFVNSQNENSISVQITAYATRNPNVKDKTYISVNLCGKEYLSKKDFDLSDAGELLIVEGKEYANYIDYILAAKKNNDDILDIYGTYDTPTETMDKGTSRGIKIGDTKAEVLKKYKNIRYRYYTIEKGEKIYNYIETSNIDFIYQDGTVLSFRFDQNDKVMLIGYGYMGNKK